jgi:hypothetical protein
MTDTKSEIAWKSLNDRIEAIQTGGYPTPIRQYLDEIHGKERFEWGNDRDQTYNYIRKQYPDERSSVLYALYVAYSFYLEDIEALELDSSRTGYEKMKKREEIRDHFFRGKLKEIIFPPHPSQKVEEFVLFAEDYVQKQPLTFSNERKRKFQMIRNEIFKSDSYEARKWETTKTKKQILTLIFQKELSLMGDIEKTHFLEAKLREEEAGHFWN